MYVPLHSLVKVLFGMNQNCVQEAAENKDPAPMRGNSITGNRDAFDPTKGSHANNIFRWGYVQGIYPSIFSMLILIVSSAP